MDFSFPRLSLADKFMFYRVESNAGLNFFGDIELGWSIVIL